MDSKDKETVEYAIDLIADLIISHKITGDNRQKALDAVDLLAECVK